MKSSRWRQLAAAFIIVGYLGFLGVYLCRQIVGDVAPGAVSYFFTWDMFPYYHAWSSRRTAIGKTAGGRYVELVPAGGQRYRGGADGQLTRADLDRSGQVLQKMADRAVARTAAIEADPVVHIWLLSEIWPEKKNLRPDLYRRFWDSSAIKSAEDSNPQSQTASHSGSPTDTKPQRTYWQSITDYDLKTSSGQTRSAAGGLP